MNDKRLRTARPARNWYDLFWGRLPLEHETALFVLVNVLDFLLTFWLMFYGTLGGQRIVESNPLAEYFLYRWGPVKGMLMFKLGMVVFVILITQIIAMRKLRTARRVLQFSTLIVSLVLVYSVQLFLRH